MLQQSFDSKATRTKPRERDLLAAVKEHLTLLQNMRKLAFTRIHVMPVLRQTGKKVSYSKNADMKGFSDLEIILPPHGRAAYIELKRPGGKRTPEQVAFQRARAEMGCPCAFVENFDEYVRFLISLGVQP